LRPPVIDAHRHAVLGTKLLQPWSTRADIEITLDHMAEAGIDRSVIFAIENPGYERANEEIAAICAGHPGKFAGFARHDADLERARMAGMLRREIEKLGLQGLKIIGSPPPRDVLEFAADLRLPLLWHADNVAIVRKHAEAFPKIGFIIAHMGSYGAQWPEYLEAIKAARECPNFYLDTSSVAFWRILELAAKDAGPEKVIFGSDAPGKDARLALYRIKLLKLAPEQETKILGGNIQRLLMPEKEKE
jgi:uncharacterized protein